MFEMATTATLWALLLVFGSVVGLKRMIYTKDPVTIEKSFTLESKLECAAWANNDSLTPSTSFKYDKETGLCTIYKMLAISIYNSMNKSFTEGTPYYIDVKCIPTSCSLSESIAYHDDPSAFPPNLAIYTPFHALSGTSFTVQYYTTPSLNLQGGSLSMTLWNQTFLDGTYPLWTPEDYVTQKTLVHVCLDIFNNKHGKKDHPIVALVRGGSWNYATVLGAGHRTYGNHLSFGYSASSDQYYFIKSDEEIIQRGVWQHIGATYNADTGVATLYLNGEEIKSEFFSTGLQTYSMDQLNIHHTGKMEPSASGHNNCQGCATTHQELYKRSLSAAEVQQVYNRGYTCSYPGNECTSDP